MNILILSWRDPKHPLAGGAEQVMHEHAKGWVQAGHRVSLFASSFPGAKRKEVVDGVHVLRYGSYFLGVHIWAFFWYLFGRHPKLDLVVDQFHGIPFFTSLYIGAPRLAVLQEVAREVWFLNQLPRPFDWIVGWVGYLSEPLILFLYRWTPFMVGSESAKQDLIKFGIPVKNVTVVPHGVIVKRPSPMPQKEKTRTVIFLGALTKDKGVEDALRAFSILNKHGNFKFWVVGKGSPSYVAFLEQMAKGIGIEKKVKFWGFVSQGEKFELLARAHVMVNPSIREGWGLVNIEANAVGTPVVGYNVVGTKESVKSGRSGVLVEAGKVDALAAAVLELATHSKEYKLLQKGAVSWSKEFSWVKSRKVSLSLIEFLYARQS